MNVLSKYNHIKEITKPLKCCRIYYIKTVETHCVSCKVNTASKNFIVSRTNKID